MFTRSCLLIDALLHAMYYLCPLARVVGTTALAPPMDLVTTAHERDPRAESGSHSLGDTQWRKASTPLLGAVHDSSISENSCL